MKLSFVGLLLLAVSIFSVSCDKDVKTSDLTLDMSQKATVVVHVYAELDKTTLGYEKAPDGTKVFVLINNSDFNSGANGLWIDTVYVKNGKIEMEIPTVSSGVDVEVRIADFIAQQKQAHGSFSETTTRLYSGDVDLSDVLPGETRIDEIKCSDDLFSNEVEQVSRKFLIKAITNVDNGSEKVSGVDVTFYNGDFSTTVTTDSEGIVEVILPKGETSQAEFTASKKWDLVETGTKTFKYSLGINSYNSSSPTAVELSFDEGVLFQ